ncbi:MAG: DNA polymerase III subunit beta [Nitrospira sp.]|nr:DNA polymerase III subunit beta [Nitrospira sp.]
MTIAREELLTAVQRVQGIVERRNTMPSLANVLLEAKPDGLEILATDLELGMRGLYKATVTTPGSVAFPAKKLLDIIREIREPDIRLTVADSATVTITAGRSQFKVVGLPGKEYPPLPAIERTGLIPLPGDGMRQLIRQTVFAVGDNDTRYVLNGLLITIPASAGMTEGGGDAPVIRLVGTDGHRLAVADHKLDTGNTDRPDRDIHAIIPKKAALTISRLLEESSDEAMIGVTTNMLIFRKSGLVLTSRLMEGTYPNYQQVIPKGSKNTIAVSRTDLEGAVRRVSVLSPDRNAAVKLTFSEKSIALFASAAELGEAAEDIPAECHGEPFSTGFNARYLLDVLSVIDGDQLILDMDAPLSPCLILERNTPLLKTVVMPVKA